MNKLKIVIFLSVLAGALLACSEIEEPMPASPETSETSSMQNSKYRSNEELINIALEAYNAIKGHALGESASRAGSTITITPILPRLSRGSSDTLIQVVNYGNNQGFALVGAQKGSKDLLALVEAGDYNPIETSQVEGFQDFITRAESMLSSRPNIGDTTICLIDTKTVMEYVRTDFSGPNIETQWGQMDVFGAYCPNHICGCVPLAVEMVMSYFEHPASMTFTFPERDLNYSTLNWPGMKSHFKRHSDTWPAEWNGIQLPDASNCPAIDMDHSNLGRVARQIGYEMHSIYMEGETGTLTCGVPLEYLKQKFPGFTLERSGSFSQNLITGLESGVIMAVSDDHGWVIDGHAFFMIYENTYRDYAPNVVGGDWRLIKSEIIGFNDLIHQNWGWNGQCNGYFLLDCYDPDDGIEYDPGSSRPTIAGYDSGAVSSYEFCLISR